MPYSTQVGYFGLCTQEYGPEGMASTILTMERSVSEMVLGDAVSLCPPPIQSPWPFATPWKRFPASLSHPRAF